MTDLLSSLGSAGALLLFVLGFGFLIFIHELGHFLVAKWVGIKVTQFAIGFGHSLLTWRKGIGLRVGSTEREYQQRISEHLKRLGDLSPPAQSAPSPAAQDRAARELGLGETEYRFNWLPLGGYVKMLGQEDMDPAARSEDPRSFNRKSISARAAVISAGVVMNLISGAIFFIIAFRVGVDFPPAVVGMVNPSSPAATVYAQGHDNDPTYRGLRSGDHVAAVNGEPTIDFMDLAVATALSSAEVPVELSVMRDGQPLVYRIKPEPDFRGIRTLGVSPPTTLVLGKERDLSDLPAVLKRAGVTYGMVATSIDGQPAERFDQLYEQVTSRRGEPVTVVFRDPKSGAERSVELRATPLLARSKDPKAPAKLAGLAPATRIVEVVEKSPAQAAGLLAGDLLARVGEYVWPTTGEVFAAVRNADGKPVPVAIERHGKVIDMEPIRPGKDKRLGIVMAMADNVISRTLPGSAAAMGLDHPPGGSRILAVDGQPIRDFADLQRVLADRAVASPEGFTVTVRHEDNLAGKPVSESTLTIDAEGATELARARWDIADGVADMIFEPLTIRVSADSIPGAAMMGLKKTHQVMMQTYLFILRASQGSLPLSQASGPVGIIHYGTVFADKGWPYLLFFLGLISVNLVVINLLPIPIVDGGHLLFLLIEKIKGSPVSARVQTAATLVGLALIGSVFLFVTYHDLGRLWQSLGG